MLKQRILFVFGTRPEAIKLAPLIKQMEKEYEFFDISVCSSGQHDELLTGVLSFFDIVPDYSLSVMTLNQSLNALSCALLDQLDRVYANCLPDFVVVQGDTTTAFMAGLAAFYRQIKVIHVEAGLRSYRSDMPFPEEMNRCLLSQLSFCHFAPTEQSYLALIKEGVHSDCVHVVGNTVIDALQMGLRSIRSSCLSDYDAFFSSFGLDINTRFILLTIHRRENFGHYLDDFIGAVIELIARFPFVSFVIPLHPNPNVQTKLRARLSSYSTVFLLPPLDYPYFVYLLSHCYFVVTDSGGLQEEAPSLGKPVFVFRDVTERAEAVESGTVLLMGRQKEKVVQMIEHYLTSDDDYQKMAMIKNPYGTGDSCSLIISVLKKLLFIPVLS